MKKIYYFLILLLLIVTSEANGQVVGDFDMHSMKWRWGSNTESYLANIGFTNGAEILSHSYIYGSGDPDKVNLTLVRGWLDDRFPSATSSGYLLLNWETGPFETMRKSDVGTTAFKVAEAEILKLINGVKSFRPNLKIGMYRMPFRFWTQSQNTYYNGEGKFNNIFAKVDYIGPSLYILKADEEVGHARNLQYIKENLNVALAYGKKFNKPVIPFIWHRVHPFAERYAFEIIQKEVLAKYIKYIYAYSYNSYKVAGVVWWDGIGGQYNNLSGINNCLNGTVYNESTYDAMIVNYAKHIKTVLSGTTTSTPPPVSSQQQLASFTLINADTDQPILTIGNGATLNLASLPTRNLNIRANTSPSTVGSVKIVLSGTQSRTQTQSSAPYALFSESDGNYAAWTPALGTYNLEATPYTSSGATGTAGTKLAITFTVTNQTTSNPAPTANAGSDKTITIPTASVQLNGSGTDSNGSIAGYSWTQVSGPGTAVFSSKTVAAPTVSSLVAGTYVFGLTVKDNAGASSTSDRVTVQVNSSTSNGQQVVSFTLINADTDQEIKTIAPNATLNLANLPTRNLNIRVNTYPEKVGSVVSIVSGARSTKSTQGGRPYSVFGDDGGNYLSWVPALGSYTLKSTPYTSSGGTGTAGTSLTINFTVVNQTTMLATSTLSTEMFASEESELSADPDDNNEAATTQETVIQESDFAETMAVYPNPATNKLQIEASELSNSSVTIRMFNQTGMAVLIKTIDTNNNGLDYVLDISELISGRYILEVSSKNATPVRTHIMVE